MDKNNSKKQSGVCEPYKMCSRWATYQLAFPLVFLITHCNASEAIEIQLPLKGGEPGLLEPAESLVYGLYDSHTIARSRQKLKETFVTTCYIFKRPYF